MLVPVVSTPGVRASRASGIKKRKLGGLGHSALKCTLSRSSIWELRDDVPRWNEESPGLHLSWLVPLASKKNAPDRSAQDCEASGNVQKTAQKTAQIVPGRLDRGCEGAQRPHAGWPVIQQHGRLLRSKCGLSSTQRTSRQRSLRNWHSQKSSPPWAVVNPSIPSARLTLLTVADALDSAGYRSASSYIVELRLRHVELDFKISPALDRAFKKVNDAVTRGSGPVKKAPEVKLSTIKHDTDTLIVGSADAYVISLHWLLRADETEGVSLGMTSLFLHEGMSGPGDVTLRLPTSKTDPRGNGASRRLTCICKLPVEVGDTLPEACPVCAVPRQVLVCARCSVRRSTMIARGSRSSQGRTVHVHQKHSWCKRGAWPLRRMRSLRGTALAGPVPNVTLDKVGPCG